MSNNPHRQQELEVLEIDEIDLPQVSGGDWNGGYGKFVLIEHGG
jgi:hypothetical protein